MSYFKAKIRFDLCWGVAPDHTGGAYSALPEPLAGFKGPTSREGEERKRRGEERGGERRVGERYIQPLNISVKSPSRSPLFEAVDCK